MLSERYASCTISEAYHCRENISLFHAALCLFCTYYVHLQQTFSGNTTNLCDKIHKVVNLLSCSIRLESPLTTTPCLSIKITPICQPKEQSNGEAITWYYSPCLPEA